MKPIWFYVFYNSLYPLSDSVYPMQAYTSLEKCRQDIIKKGYSLHRITDTSYCIKSKGGTRVGVANCIPVR